ncbi:MAG: ATP-binding protein [Bacteroidota bacterium]
MLDKLIPDSFKKDRKVYRGSVLMIRISLLALLSSIILTPLFYQIGYTEGYHVGLYAGLNVLFFMALMYHSANLTLAGNYFALHTLVVFTILIWSSGGLDSPFLMWLITIPTVTVFYLKKLYRRIWTGLTGLTVFMFWLGQLWGYDFPRNCPAEWLPFFAFLSYLLVSILFVAVIRSFGISYRIVRQKLERSNKELKHSNKELERFAYIASHDLKSPLRNIVSFLNLFERRYSDKVDDTGREYLQYVSESAQQMHLLVDDILEYSRTTNRKAKVESVNLNVLLTQISKQLREQPDYQRAVIEWPELPVFEADNTLLMQLFQNFLENGLKYNDSSEPQVLIRYEQRDGHQYFAVEDNGIGLDPKFKDQIFEMFKRLHNKNQYPGTGIGLAICKRIIEDYGGQVWVDTEVNKGTTIHFTLAVPTLSPSVLPVESHKPSESLAL